MNRGDLADNPNIAMDRITPVDLERTRFRKILRGYDPEEVDELISRVSAELETLLRELRAAQDDHERCQFELETFKTQEQTLRDALFLANKMAEETKLAAQHEAELILEETRGTADKLHSELHGKISDLRWELEKLRLEKQKFLSRFGSMLEEFLVIVERAKHEDDADTDDPDEPHIKVV